MQMLNIHEAGIRFPLLLTEIEQNGEMFVICRDGKPIADMIPHSQKKRTRLHPIMSRINIKYDPTETLTSEEWSEEE